MEYKVFIKMVIKEKQEFVDKNLKKAYVQCIEVGIKFSTLFLKRLVLEKGDIDITDWQKLGLIENEEII